MPGIADLLYLGQPDPARQLAAMLSGQQPQGAPPQGPAPPAATPAPAGGAAAAPGDGANPSPGDPPPPGSPPQPQALTPPPAMAQSYQQLANPPSLMNLYLQMQQRQQAEAGFNSGLALIAANHSPPSMRQSIMQALTGNQGDAGTTVNNLMSLYGAQNQMAAQQQLLAQAPAIAQKLNMDEGVVRAQIMAGRGDELVKSMEPGEQQKNILFMHDQYINNGGNEADWRKNVLPTVMMGSLPGMTPDYMSYMKEAQDWPQTHPGQPTPDFVQWKNIVQQEQAQTKEKTDMVTTAQGQMHTLLGPLTSMEGKVNDLQDAFKAGKLDKLFAAPNLIKSIAESPNLSTANSYASSLLTSLGLPSLTQEDVNHAKDIYELSQGQQSLHALGSVSSRAIAPQFETIGSFLGPLGDLSRGKDSWGGNLDKLRDNILNGEATVYGEANITPTGDDTHVNELLKRMPAQYIAGGAMNLRTPTPIPSDEMAKATALLKQHPDQASTIFQVLQAQNYDIKDLKQRFQQGLK